MCVGLIWEHYEYPFIFFIGKEIQEDYIIEQLKKNSFLSDTISDAGNKIGESVNVVINTLEEIKANRAIEERKKKTWRLKISFVKIVIMLIK